jgi:hypothetical protein
MNRTFAMAIRSVEDLKAHSREVNGSKFGRVFTNWVSWFLEIVSVVVATFFIVLDWGLLKVGPSIPLSEAPLGRHLRQRVDAYDPELEMLLGLATVGLVVGAVLLVLLAWLLASARRRRNEVALLCEGVEKLRDSKFK